MANSFGRVSEERIYEGAPAETRLLGMGLASGDLIRAVETYEMQRRSCSPLMPCLAVGISAYGASFVSLGESLIANGWSKRESRGLARMVNVARKIGIAICTGDEGVGVGTGRPRSKYPRGIESARILAVNNGQLYLPIVDPPQPSAEEDESDITTWWLLVHSNGRDILRAELSLPIGELDGEEHLASWSERIILNVPPIDTLRGRRDNDDDLPLEITVDVRPR